MSVTPPQDPKKKKIVSLEQEAMQLHPIRFAPKEPGSKEERTQRLDSFLRTLGPEKPNKSSDTTSQKENTFGTETLNGRKPKDDIGVSYGGLDSSQREIKGKLQIDQQRRGYNAITDILDINNRLNKIHKQELTDDYMKDRGVDPKEFRYAGKKLHKYLKDDLDGNLVSSIDYEIAYKKFNRMAHKLGDIDKRIGGRYFEV